MSRFLRKYDSFQFEFRTISVRAVFHVGREDNGGGVHGGRYREKRGSISLLILFLFLFTFRRTAYVHKDQYNVIINNNRGLGYSSRKIITLRWFSDSSATQKLPVPRSTMTNRPTVPWTMRLPFYSIAFRSREIRRRGVVRTD